MGIEPPACVLFLLAALCADACFLQSDKPHPVKRLFNESTLDLLRNRFLANFNVHGTGAIAASPGAVPALDDACGVGGCPGGYFFHWTRDGALSIMTLVHLASSSAAFPGFDQEKVKETLRAYVRWVELQQKEASRRGESPAQQAKWNISSGQPYAFGWCRPQSDGPGLEAKALVAVADTLAGHKDMRRIWPLVRADLDWVAESGASQLSCDLWEESTGTANLFWNRVTMRLGLHAGVGFARRLGHEHRAARWKKAAEALGDPVADHLHPADGDGCFISECPPERPGSGCKSKDKFIDGAVMLGLSHWWRQAKLVDAPILRPTSKLVAQTVETYNERFCTIYPVNQRDSSQQVPGVLYGRYTWDAYGGGPWPLITASLASMLYQAAQAAAGHESLPSAERDAWRKALNAKDFMGTPSEFILAGDSVLLRIFFHVRPEDKGSLYEQFDKVTGKPYNAKDLTWSYAEVFNALYERSKAWSCQGTGTELEQCSGWLAPDLNDTSYRMSCLAARHHKAVSRTCPEIPSMPGSGSGSSPGSDFTHSGSWHTHEAGPPTTGAIVLFVAGLAIGIAVGAGSALVMVRHLYNIEDWDEGTISSCDESLVSRQ